MEEVTVSAVKQLDLSAEMFRGKPGRRGDTQSRGCQM
jgi:hypothetical protein